MSVSKWMDRRSEYACAQHSELRTSTPVILQLKLHDLTVSYVPNIKDDRDRILD